MSDIPKYLKEQLKNDNFKKEWDKLQPEFYVIDALIEARKSKGITQKHLAAGLGMFLKIEFVPVK